MNIYNQTSKIQLQDKIGYEIWLLDFLSKTQETFEGGTDLSTITLTNRQAEAHISNSFTEVLGARLEKKVMDNMSPLTFTASYKMLDMIFEWILEKNRTAGYIKNVPWRFSEKIKLIKNSQLSWPQLFRSHPYIKNYLIELYSNLLKFRNEIVHRHNFLVVDNKLKINTIEDGKAYRLEVEQEEFGAFVRISVAAVNLLTDVISYGSQEERWFKYNLDRINKFHGLKRFEQKKPLSVNVILKVPLENNVFPADLKFVRHEVKKKYRDVEVMFNLKVYGLVNNIPSFCWFFPIKDVPEKELLELSPNSHMKYRFPFSKNELI